jgi:hypothetical protein
VRGFFLNGGGTCWIQRVDGQPGAGHVGAQTLSRLLDAPASLIAFPDAYGLAGGAATAAALQRRLIGAAAESQNRMVVVDPPPGLIPADAVLWRRRTGVDSAAAVVYYPWIEVLGAAAADAVTVPPCGHVLGSWVRAEDDGGLHRAPTAQPLLGVDGLPASLTAAEPRSLNRQGVNCLRAFPGPSRGSGGRERCPPTPTGVTCTAGEPSPT